MKKRIRGRTRILDESYLKAINKMIADGLNNNEMADRLNVTGKTIGNFKREYGLINTNRSNKGFFIGNKIEDWKIKMFAVWYKDPIFEIDVEQSGT